MNEQNKKLREEFVRLLTEDIHGSFKNCNQALFDKDTGNSIFEDIDFDMVMETFDKAVKYRELEEKTNDKTHERAFNRQGS